MFRLLDSVEKGEFYVALFKIADLNSNGVLSVQELKVICDELKWEMSHVQWEMGFEEFESFARGMLETHGM